MADLELHTKEEVDSAPAIWGEEFNRALRSEVHQYLIEFKVLMKKNFLLTRRNWKSTTLQLVLPIILIIALFGIARSLAPNDKLNPKPSELAKIPKCTAFKSKCHSLIWLEGDPTPYRNSFAPINIKANINVTQIMDEIVADSGLTYGTLDDNHAVVKWTGTELKLQDYILKNTNITQAVVIFYPNITLFDQQGYYGVWFEIQTNGTTEDAGLTAAGKGLKIYLHSQIYSKLTREYYRFLSPPPRNTSVAPTYLLDDLSLITPNLYSDSDFTFRVNRRAYPKLAANTDISLFLGIFFFFSIMLNYMFFLYSITNEKELQLRQGMKMMGVSDGMYWLSWFVWMILFYALYCMILVVTGIIFDIAWFSITDFGVLYLTFFLFGFALTPITILLSMVMSTTKQAIFAAVALIFVGIIFQIVLTIPLIIQLIYNTKSTPEAVPIIFQFYPPFNFAKLITDIGRLSTEDAKQRGSNGFSWQDLYRKPNFDSFTTPAPVDSFGYQIMCFAVYGFISIVLYIFLPTELNLLARITRKPLNLTQDELNQLDSDVKAEYSSVQTDTTSAVRIVNLWKKWRKITCIDGANDPIAVKGLCLAIKEGQVFALLGHNGAGKTTTINMMTGLFPPDSGDVVIFGKSARTEIRSIHKMIGVCPQHNILWPELTAREHVDLFADLKGIPRDQRKKMVEDRLRDVLLHKVADNLSSTFSGGMKRRLSVAIASSGNPKVMFLDEPTTGLDPMSRREIWGAIQRLKAGRVIILTTHSMEEADVLGDNVGIMAHGQMKCLGTSLHLKTKYGVGYRLSFTSSNAEQNPLIKQLVSQYLPDAQILTETGISINYALDTSHLHRLQVFFEWLEKNVKSTPIRDWGISQSTLEDVFMRVGD